MFGPLGFWTMAPLHYAAKCDPFSLNCVLHPGTIQGKEGIKFCHLATLALGGPLWLQRAPSAHAHDQPRRSKRSPFFPNLIQNMFPNFIPALDRFEENNRGGFLEDFIDIERDFFGI